MTDDSSSNGRDVGVPALPEAAADGRDDLFWPPDICCGKRDVEVPSVLDGLLACTVAIEARPAGVKLVSIELDRNSLHRVSEIDARDEDGSAPDLVLRDR
jgi:hypothetical protein